MAVPKSKVEANKRYRAKTYDTIGFDVPKGKRDEYKGIAAEMGLSLAKFLFFAAEAYKPNHMKTDLSPVKPAPELTTDQRRLIEAAEKLPKDSRAIVIKLIENFAAHVDTKGGDSNDDDRGAS